MKSALLVIAVMAIIGSAQAGAQPSDQSARQTVVTLKVSGMQCHLCAAAVERTAKGLTGVTAATADQPKGLAEVTYNPSKTSPEEIARLLTKQSGFKAEVPKRAK